MEESRRRKKLDYQYGTEILLANLRGRSRHDEAASPAKSIHNLNDQTLTGKYMSMKLLRLFVNIPLQSTYDKRIRSFTVLEALFHNMWGYRLKTLSTGSSKMIDSEGFQHDGDGCHYHEFL